MPDRPPKFRDRTSAGTAGVVSRQLETSGFTLIEVLVVVAIIALLVSILIPAFVSARESARLAVCLSNQKNIAAAWFSYFHDSRGILPRGNFTHATYGGKQGRNTNYGGPGDATDVRRFLNKHLKLNEVVGAYPHGLPADQQDKAQPAKIPDGARVFQCPGDSGPLWLNLEKQPYSYFDYFGTSYRTNRYLIGRMPPLSPSDACSNLIYEVQRRWVDPTFNVSIFANTGRLVLTGDFSSDGWQYAGNIDPPQEFHARARRSVGSSTSGTGWFYYNLAFMDGHAKYTGVAKGIYVNPNYTMIPFRDLQERFAKDQRPGYYPNP